MNTTDKIRKINEWQKQLENEKTTLSEKRAGRGLSIQSASTFAGISLASGFKIEHGGGESVSKVYKYYKVVMEAQNG